MTKTVKRGIKIKLYPNKIQKDKLDLNISLSTFVYNKFLALQKERFKNMSSGAYLSKFTCNKILTQLKKEYPFLKQADSNALIYTLRNLDAAYQNFFAKRAKAPRFISRKQPRNSYTTRRMTFVSPNKINLPKIKGIRVRGLAQHYDTLINSKIYNQTVTRDQTGNYYLSIIYDAKIETLPKTNKSIGIDLGLTHLAIQSDGYKKPNLYFNKKARRELLIWQRKYSRRYEQAKKKIAEAKAAGVDLDIKSFKNLEKARIRLAKMHKHIANQRSAYLHNYTSELCKNYDLVALEKLKSKNMMKNHRLAGSIGDVSWYQFKQMLTYKMETHNKKVIEVSPKNTSRICSNCGKNTGAKPLHVREWTCPYCNTHHDRDINASVNILNKALKQID